MKFVPNVKIEKKRSVLGKIMFNLTTSKKVRSFYWCAEVNENLAREMIIKLSFKLVLMRFTVFQLW